MGTNISYCDETLEVTGGCDKCSPGCRECWAIREVWRMAHNPLLGDKWKGLVEKKDGKLNWTSKISLFPEALTDKKLRGKNKRIFIDSKADLFHEKVPFEFIDKVFETVAWCQGNPTYKKHSLPNHTFLMLTKRVKQAAKYFKTNPHKRWGDNAPLMTCLPNIHLGVTVCNQKEADEKIPILLQIPGKRWLSIEPMLGYMYIYKYLKYINQVIVGCESGSKRRLCCEGWIESIVDQCKAAGVPVYVKQMEINGKVVTDLSKMPAWAVQEMI